MPLRGAAGAVGSTQGRGDTAAVADYNSDGFLDILVTNGFGNPPLNFDGPTELFHNMGNTNHWLEIDLVGVSSNADGIGAVVFVDAGGVRQVRFQGGGMHFASQDHRRLHFGLAGNTVIDQIVIKWPSGIQQTLTNVSADQVLQITEDSDTDGDGLSDGDEVNIYMTNPQDPDSDSDGLQDGAEVNLHVTNPLDYDTDNDGAWDGMEVAAGTDPLDILSFPSTPDGDISGDGKVNAADVLLGLRIQSNLITPTSYQSIHGDVAPLIDGNPAPDGKIDLGDIILIQRKALGLISF